MVQASEHVQTVSAGGSDEDTGPSGLVVKVLAGIPVVASETVTVSDGSGERVKVLQDLSHA